MGEALGLIDAFERLREVLANPDQQVVVGDWTLISTWDDRMLTFSLDPVAEDAAPTVIYHPKAWSVVGGVLGDVPCGGYLSPFDFGDVGFCHRPQRDIGVTVLGTIRYDLLNPRRSPVKLPESWQAAKSRLRAQGLGATIRLAYTPSLPLVWIADLVRLGTADVLAREFVTAPSTDEVSELLLHSEDLPIL